MQTLMDRRISDAYNYGKKTDLEELRTELLAARAKTSDFIDLFLDKYDEQMSNPMTAHDDPKWKLYRKKHAEYGEQQRLLISVNYFLNKSV